MSLISFFCILETQLFHPVLQPVLSKPLWSETHLFHDPVELCHFVGLNSILIQVIVHLHFKYS